MRELSCDVIRDLLPAVADEVASEDTRALVEDHVKTCADCRAALTAMRAPGPAPAADEKEIDYLKKTRKRSFRAVIGAALAVLALCAAALAVRAFVIGSEGDPAWLMSEAAVVEDTLALRCSPDDSAGAVGRLRFSDEDGVVTVTARRVLASPLHQGSAEATYTAGEPIRRVVVNDRVVWDEGARISPFTAKLFALRNPYVGDASADMALLRALLEGDYTIELQTEAEPYGMTVHMHCGVDAPTLFDRGCVMLALTENLGEISFLEDGKTQAVVVTEADADARLLEATGTAASVKDSYDRPVLLQTMLQGLQMAGPACTEGEVRMIAIRNGTDLPIQTISVEQWFGGELCQSETGMNADESPLMRGNALDFAAPTFAQYEVRLTFTTADGQTYTAAGFDPAAETLTITGSVGEGFTLTP